MKLFKIRGGVHPDDKKDLSRDKPISVLPLPKVLRIPLQQHIGAPAEPVVAKGDHVLKGQLLAVGQGPVSAPVHAPTSGQIMAIGRYVAPHPSGLPGRTISLKPDGRDVMGQLFEPLNLNEATPEQISARVAEAGIVGMGGATFPAAVKLGLGGQFDLHTLVINGAECEPYLTCDDRLMRERAAEVVDGVYIMAKALGVEKVIFAIEANKPEATSAIRFEAAKIRVRTGEDVTYTVGNVPTQYPMGSERHLVQTLTGLETPARALTASLGVVVHNSATAFAVHEAVRLGKPLMSRVVTVSGGAMAETANLEVPIGTPIQTLIDHVGGFKSDPARIVAGGPMMGQPLPDPKAPVIKGVNGVLALTEKEIPEKDAHSCIRCASCVRACPCGLVPLEMAARIKKEDLDGASRIGVGDCVNCGSCSFVCPSNIPLVQYFNYAKGKLAAQRRAEVKLDETKRLAEARTGRLERIAREKRELMAKRKAEMAAKKKAEAEAQAGADERKAAG